MRILDVISIKTFERYGYAFLRDIFIHRADYNKYKISEADFKILHSDDFEDLYLFHLQGKLNRLPGSDKVYLYNAINLWIRNIVIRQCMGDLQIDIKSYQTKLNLTEPIWDASDFLFKEDYTIVRKPRAVIYRDRNDQKKMLRENEVHNFSDGMENRIWSEDDKRRSEEFMEKTAPKADKPVKPAPAKQVKPATAKQPKPNPIKDKSTKPTPLQKTDKGKVTKVHNEKRSLQLVDEPDEEQDQPRLVPEPQDAGEEYDLGRVK
nr:hypothetical protein [Tanacetum cinerariifolium]